MSFYNFTNSSAGGDELYIDGEIASDASWWGNVIDPHSFRQRLARCKDVTVFINSPGGDVFAGCEIYTMLREHPYAVTVKISGLAASAASIIAMAGDTVLMSPVGHMMVHYPWMLAAGNAKQMDYAATVLREIGEGIIAAYVNKTGKTHDEIAALLDAETYMNANHCIAEGFADGILYEEANSGKPGTGTGAAAAAKMSCKRYSIDAICAMMTEGQPSGTSHTHTPNPHAHPLPPAALMAHTQQLPGAPDTDAEIGKRMQEAAMLPMNPVQAKPAVQTASPVQPAPVDLPQERTAERRAIAQRAELLRDVCADLLAHPRT